MNLVIELLGKHLSILEINEPISRNEGLLDLADLQARLAHEAREAICILEDNSNVKPLVRVAACADRLERWMSENVGGNEDWPVMIKGEEAAAYQLAILMNDLKSALIRYREGTIT